MANTTSSHSNEADRLKQLLAKIGPKVSDKEALRLPLESKRLAAYLIAQGCVVGEAHNYPEGIKIKVMSGLTGQAREETFQSPSLVESLLLAIAWIHR